MLPSKLMQLPSYSSLEWRLDVELAKRSLMHTCEPVFVLKVNMLKDEDKSSVILEADAAHMKHIEAQLAAAVAELTTTRTSRLVRYVR